jgi:hypothetical protein
VIKVAPPRPYKWGHHKSIFQRTEAHGIALTNHPCAMACATACAYGWTGGAGKCQSLASITALESRGPRVLMSRAYVLGMHYWINLKDNAAGATRWPLRAFRFFLSLSSTLFLFRSSLLYLSLTHSLSLSLSLRTHRPRSPPPRLRTENYGRINGFLTA